MKLSDVPKNVYFAGIGGVSMSGLAKHLFARGYNVSGCDDNPSQNTQTLQNLGLTIQICDVKLQNCQLLVHTSALSKDHKALVLAKKHAIPTVLREELLGAIFDEYATRIAICGTHGKTTATAMLHHVLQKCGVLHTAFIGGNYRGENYFDSGGNIVIAEACEYNASFLHLHPTHTLCLNMEYDHPDCYKSLADVEQAFARLFEQSKQVILPKNLIPLCKNATNYNDFCAKRLRQKENKTTFDLFLRQEFVGKVAMPLSGRYNVQNAIAVICLCHQLNLPLLQVINALATFCGVERRWAVQKANPNVICDYAHHPTEITATIKRAQTFTRGKVFCIFQPHTYTRTRAFWHQFVSCFTHATVLYLPIFPARELPIDGINSLALCQQAKTQGIDATYCDNFQDAVAFAKSQLTPQDTLLILGAGDVVKIADMF